MARHVSWATFRAEVVELYSPPLRRIATQRKMNQVLREFGQICRTTRDLSPASVARWLAGPSAGRRPATNRTLLSSLRAACSYGECRGYLTSPFRYRSLDRWLPDPEDWEPICRHVPIVDIARVLARADSEALGGSWDARRVRAVVYTLSHTGGRAREILGLSVADCDLAAGVIRIRPNDRRGLKTRQSRRELPIPGPLAVVLGEWLGRSDRVSEWAFPHSGLSGPWLWGTVASRALGHVRALGDRAGVSGLTLLSFRHAFASAAEAWGLGELALQRILGHGRPETQRRYRHPAPEQLRPSLDRVRFGPMDRA